MPILESKKTGLHSNVSLDTWNEIKEKGWQRRYKVLDDSDLVSTIAEAPIDVKDFMNKEAVKVPDEPEAITLDDYTIKELQDMLQAKDVEFLHNQRKQYYIDLINGL